MVHLLNMYISCRLWYVKCLTKFSKLSPPLFCITWKMGGGGGAKSPEYIKLMNGRPISM